MLIFQLAIVLIYATSVLTSTVKDTSTPDLSPPPNLKKLFVSQQTETKDPTPSTDTKSVNDNASTTVSKLETKEQIFTEGGSLIQSSPKVETKSSAKPVNATEETLLPDIIPPEIFEPHEDGKKIVGRKGVEIPKTVGKKGVIYPEESSTEKSTTTTYQVVPEKKSPSVKKILTTEIPVLETQSISQLNENSEVKSTLNDTELNKKHETVGNRTIATVIRVPGHSNNTVTHKKKPTSTTGEGDDDGKGMPSSPTQAEIGMPRKVDYIIPVVITIMATPVLGIAAFVLYTRGKDCWEKRHYRRMDFLIDGMYND